MSLALFVVPVLVVPVLVVMILVVSGVRRDAFLKLFQIEMQRVH
jgi:hypothetical protein